MGSALAAVRRAWAPDGLGVRAGTPTPTRRRSSPYPYDLPYLSGIAAAACPARGFAAPKGQGEATEARDDGARRARCVHTHALMHARAGCMRDK